MAVLCLLLGAGILYMWDKQDRVAPEITIPDAKVNYIEGTIDNLLEGVTAHDDRDGNVSGSLYVKVSADAEKGKAYITYYAKDNSNNVSQKVREAGMGAKVNSEPETTTIQQEETPAVTPMPEETPTPELTLPPEATLPPTETRGENPQITLTNERVIVAKGTEINRILYVKDIVDDKDDRVELFGQIQIKGEVDTSTTGDYDLIYYVVDSDGNQSNEAKMTVVVE